MTFFCCLIFWETMAATMISNTLGFRELEYRASHKWGNLMFLIFHIRVFADFHFFGKGYFGIVELKLLKAYITFLKLILALEQEIPFWESSPTPIWSIIDRQVAVVFLRGLESFLQL